MTIAEQLRAITTQIAQLQRVADWETQIELAKAATILVGEAGRLEREPIEVERVRQVFGGVGRLRR